MYIQTKFILFLLLFSIVEQNSSAQNKRLRQHGIIVGVLPTGLKNDITDVKGVRVGHVTVVRGNDVRTGAVTLKRPSFSPIL